MVVKKTDVNVKERIEKKLLSWIGKKENRCQCKRTDRKEETDEKIALVENRTKQTPM